ncbi:conserved hypothetical protein [Streptomyces sviceus ATCC 29083]|uniref:Uncharacterized protein n=1 Tax=Streptomyces sviceus (strain ATCC 29083 / DSM 924 / JCM 4929 / NBRC 13980 / NCIMB 11184 / NRRL 5439 / UC 5370) TaxID=463191 RepID=B5HS74_STRX2|nr:conserved hypothetical protein [Streptomyces sviceus ATCC 29083]
MCYPGGLTGLTLITIRLLRMSRDPTACVIDLIRLAIACDSADALSAHALVSGPSSPLRAKT